MLIDRGKFRSLPSSILPTKTQLRVMIQDTTPHASSIKRKANGQRKVEAMERSPFFPSPQWFSKALRIRTKQSQTSKRWTHYNRNTTMNTTYFVLDPCLQFRGFSHKNIRFHSFVQFVLSFTSQRQQMIVLLLDLVLSGGDRILVSQILLRCGERGFNFLHEHRRHKSLPVVNFNFPPFLQIQVTIQLTLQHNTTKPKQTLEWTKTKISLISFVPYCWSSTASGHRPFSSIFLWVIFRCDRTTQRRTLFRWYR